MTRHEVEAYEVWQVQLHSNGAQSVGVTCSCLLPFDSSESVSFWLNETGDLIVFSNERDVAVRFVPGLGAQARNFLLRKAPPVPLVLADAVGTQPGREWLVQAMPRRSQN